MMPSKSSEMGKEYGAEYVLVRAENKMSTPIIMIVLRTYSPLTTITITSY